VHLQEESPTFTSYREYRNPQPANGMTAAAGNFASIIPERAAECVIRSQPMHTIQRPNCFPGIMAARASPGGLTSQMLTLTQLQQYGSCDYARTLALAKARGQAPEPCVPVPFTNQRYIPPTRCGPSQQDANAGQPVPVDTCYNLIGITQKRIN